MQPSAAGPARSRIEIEVLRIRALLERGQFSGALTDAQALCAEVPENRDVLYIIAVSQRYLRHIDEALATLERLETVHPAYSRLFQERGHCYLAAAKPGPALDSFLRAVNMNPALPASWKALEVLFRSAGRTEDSRTAASHVAKLATLPTAVVTASSLFADGEVFEAERIIREFLQTHPSDVEAMRLLAQIGVKLDVLDDADFLLESVLTYAPTYQPARYDYVRVLLQRHRHAKALEESQKLIASDPSNRSYRTAHANVLVALGEYAEALRLYRELLAETPQAADLHLSIAHVLKTQGQQRNAIDSYRAAARVQPGYGDAYWSLANLKTYRFEEAEIERMRLEESRGQARLVDR